MTDSDTNQLSERVWAVQRTKERVAFALAQAQAADRQNRGWLNEFAALGKERYGSQDIDEMRETFRRRTQENLEKLIEYERKLNGVLHEFDEMQRQLAELGVHLNLEGVAGETGWTPQR